MAKLAEKDQLAGELRDSLTKLYGPLLPSRELWKIFGYPSPAAYRQARTRKVLPVREFAIEGRRGYFALTHDVAQWLALQSNAVTPPRQKKRQEQNEPKMPEQRPTLPSARGNAIASEQEGDIGM